MKKVLKFLLHRVVLVTAAILIQLVLLYLMLNHFKIYYVYYYSISIALSIAIVLYVINSRSNPGYQIAWIIPVMLFPVFGSLLYLIFGGKRLSNYTRRKMHRMQEQMEHYLPRNGFAMKQLALDNKTASGQAQYIQDYAFCPVYQNTVSEYFPLGEKKFARMMEEILGAKRFIFLEYFIIEKGYMWNTIVEALAEKAKQGVEVRLIYDDFGCITRLPMHYAKEMEAMGIHCCVFNPYIPVLTSVLNNRDHRKICIVDGYIGFTGGINLADEYINRVVRFGHWKDTAVMLKGKAVWNLTVMFLSMWNYIRGTKENFDMFRPIDYPQITENAGQGYIQPYTDSPLDDEPVGETVYLNLINKAQRYVYITSPYLIIGYEMITALCNAAKSGIDVRIITPHIPDKWYAYALSRSYYEILLESKVKIYEYTPGFIHAKNFIVDDEYATVGTINMDYRSLYLHFECGVWMYKADCIPDILKDYQDTLAVSTQISLEECSKDHWYKKLGRAVLRAFAPLM